MPPRFFPLATCTWVCLALASIVDAFEIRVLDPARVWKRAEFRLEGAPVTPNNFDPAQIEVDATFTAPSGATQVIPAFWYEGYIRTWERGAEILRPDGTTEWRIRYMPTEPGLYRLAVSVRTTGGPSVRAETSFQVAPESDAALRGWVRNAPDRRSFQTSEGRPVRLIGGNVCWAQSQGTRDYEQWFGAMAESGQNFARLWLSPWFMGLEHGKGTLNRYAQDAAWTLDTLFDLAERHGLYLIVAFDHHGMFQRDNENWGGSNNFWGVNPYNQANGGPCPEPNDFFTLPAAREIYQKRLRYLIGRYGYSPNLLSWQFFNEIDNVYAPNQGLQGPDVAAWHQAMGQWLRAHDPYAHLISTSLTGGSDRPELWSLPEMDFTVYHSYGDPAPARKLARLSQDFLQRYQKPVMVGEFGVSPREWAAAQDPHLRGFRQAQWGAVLGGSVGTAMSWWWESLHEHRVYPLYATLRRLLEQGGWRDGGRWTPVAFADRGQEPADLGEERANEPGFHATLALADYRRQALRGEVALANPLAAERASEYISSFLHGSRNPTLQKPIRLAARFGEDGRLSFRVNAVAARVDLHLKLDGAPFFHTQILDRDGRAAVNKEIDQVFTFAIPPGKHVLEFVNPSEDWVYLEDVRLDGLRPSDFAEGWKYGPEAVGLRNDDTGRAILYVNSPHVTYPAGAIRFGAPALEGARLTLEAWPEGAFVVSWHEPVNGQLAATSRARSRGSRLVLEVPRFSEDLVALITPEDTAH